jgi:hypothetical protein
MSSTGESGDEQPSSHSSVEAGNAARTRRTNRLRYVRRLMIPALILLILSIPSSGIVIRMPGWPALALSKKAISRKVQPSPSPVPTLGPIRNAIEAENALQGTTDWQIPSRRAATVEIQGYASAEYAAPGDTITFYVSTQQPRDPYTVDIYRIGWYGGAGGRLLLSMGEVGEAQGYFNWAGEALVACRTCTFDYVTHLLDTNWQPSFSLTVLPNWVTGLYVAKLTTREGREAYIHFTVTGNQYATYLATIPDLTTEAYDDWGGYSLYHGPDQKFGDRALMVSLNRPALGWRFAYGAGLSTVLDAIRWFERNGYNMSYTSNVEISEHPAVIFSHRAYISLGHDEYWTLTMRNWVEQARDSGIGLAFLGANAAYWNVRLQPDSRSHADRIIVCYKSAVLDPFYGKDNADVTVEWRSAPLLRPENALIGEMYASWNYPPRGFPWYPSYATRADPLGLMSGTGLRSGIGYGCNIVGYEWDQVIDNGATPPGLHILAASPTITFNGYFGESDTVYYIAKSGAFVFASGSIYFAYALDNLHLWDVLNPPSYDPCLTTARSAVILGVQILMARVMYQLPLDHRAPHRGRPG